MQKNWSKFRILLVKKSFENNSLKSVTKISLKKLLTDCIVAWQNVYNDQRYANCYAGKLVTGQGHRGKTSVSDIDLRSFSTMSQNVIDQF